MKSSQSVITCFKMWFCYPVTLVTPDKNIFSPLDKVAPDVIDPSLPPAAGQYTHTHTYSALKLMIVLHFVHRGRKRFFKLSNSTEVCRQFTAAGEDKMIQSLKTAAIYLDMLTWAENSLKKLQCIMKSTFVVQDLQIPV